MTPAAVPARCSSLSVSRPNQRPVTHGCRSWLTLAPGRRARTCSPSGRISYLYFCPRIFSYGVIRVSLLTLCRVRTQAGCLVVLGSIGEGVVASKDGILSLRTARNVRARPRALSPRSLSSDGSVTVTLVVEFASLVLKSPVSLKHQFRRVTHSFCHHVGIFDVPSLLNAAPCHTGAAARVLRHRAAEPTEFGVHQNSQALTTAQESGTAMQTNRY